ncbi:MAG TPA: methyltransferase domain-containing protein [Gaiellaceae bacterium]
MLDVGSWSPGRVSARYVFPDDAFDYVGLDIVDGNNVDLAVADPYLWDELPDESFDAVVCISVYEHNPYFWLTTAEIARVLKVGACACIVAPSSGGVHRFPLDCWRLYPDATAALAAYTGLESVESYNERPRFRKVTFGQRWRDHMSILRKPRLDDPGAFYERLAAITATRVPFPAQPPGPGAVIAEYERANTSTFAHAMRVRAALLWHRLTHAGRPSGLW